MAIAKRAHPPETKAPNHSAQISLLNDDLIVSFQNTKSLRDIPSPSQARVKNGPFDIEILSGIIDASEVR